jgi:hypothetical protein
VIRRRRPQRIQEIDEAANAAVRPIRDLLRRAFHAPGWRVVWLAARYTIGFGLPYPIAQFIITSEDHRLVAATEFLRREEVAVSLAAAYVVLLVILLVREISHWQMGKAVSRLQEERSRGQERADRLEKTIQTATSTAEELERDRQRAQQRVTLLEQQVQLLQNAVDRADAESAYLQTHLTAISGWFRQEWWYESLHLTYWLDQDPSKGRFQRTMELGFPERQPYILTSLEEIHIGAHGEGVPFTPLSNLGLAVQCVPEEIRASILPTRLNVREDDAIRHYAHVLLFSKTSGIAAARVQVNGDWPALWNPLWVHGEDYGLLTLTVRCMQEADYRPVCAARSKEGRLPHMARRETVLHGGKTGSGYRSLPAQAAVGECKS